MFARLRGGGRHAEHDEDPKGGLLGRKAEQLSGTQKALNELGLTEQFVASSAPRVSYKRVVTLYEQVRASAVRSAVNPFFAKREPGRYLRAGEMRVTRTHSRAHRSNMLDTPRGA